MALNALDSFLPQSEKCGTERVMHKIGDNWHLSSICKPCVLPDVLAGLGSHFLAERVGKDNGGYRRGLAQNRWIGSTVPEMQLPRDIIV